MNFESYDFLKKDDNWPDVIGIWIKNGNKVIIGLNQKYFYMSYKGIKFKWKIKNIRKNPTTYYCINKNLIIEIKIFFNPDWKIYAKSICKEWTKII